ncbi:GNAT family N-acetyltransferase [Actinomycetospora cinnamomea]|uniref:Acetyltransferase (GNAT) family protein n=1 Tax=Actinomycetospora cinnamomea TaxID=663609 RepID=A0A2U1FAZ3_9PSEU|nr:GNAT family N-acetyltransferase [Actinomycetospora cinnamomea]PVZ09352.1 acetyltransferase (GNAT) family protein [Actinomycetospora cinnamomea]
MEDDPVELPPYTELRDRLRRHATRRRRSATTTTTAGAPALRPLGPGDVGLLAHLVARCSPGTLAARFLTGVRPDPDRVVAALAAHLAPGTQLGVVVAGELVGCGGLVPAGPRHAEAAVLVADPWQGCGLGRQLLRQALADPRWHGQDVVVHVAVGNTRALRAARAVLTEVAGRPVVRRLDHGTVEYRALVATPHPTIGGGPPSHPFGTEEPA